MSFISELRVAGRSLARRPGWTAAAIATLALGISGAVAVGGIAYGVLERPLPYPDSERIVRVYEVTSSGSRINVADPNYLDLAGLPGFAALAELQSGTYPVQLGDEPQRITVANASRDFFSIFGLRPKIGRLFRAEELAPGRAPVALISERLWRDRLGAANDLSTLRLRISGTSYSIVGVLPARFDFPAGAEIWTPREQDGYLPSRTAHNSRVIGRIAPGTSLAVLRQQASSLAARLRDQYGDRVDLTDVAVVPLLESMVSGVRQSLVVELWAAALLLLAAIVNAASLLLARLETRRRELATRLALGARAREIALHLLAETALVIAPAGAIALAVAAAAIAALHRAAPGQLPRLDAIRLDAPTVALALALCVVAGVVLVALTVRRALGWSVETELRQGSNSVLGGGRRRLRGVSLAVQAGASLVLLVGVALMGASLERLLRVDPGFRSAGIAALDVYTPQPGSGSALAERSHRLAELLDQLRTVPGVRQVGLVSTLPMGGDAANGSFIDLPDPKAVPTTFEGFETLAHSGARTGYAYYLGASEGYFATMGIRLLEGRLFTPGDTMESQHVAVVSETVAKATWPGQSALGRFLEFGNMDGDLRPLEVIGVVADVHQTGLGDGPTPAIYTCFRQRPQGGWMWSAVMAGGADSPAAPALARSIARRVFPDAPTRFRTVSGILAQSLAERKLLVWLLALFAGAAGALAGGGVFASVALSVASRRREYALRMALGADPRDVRRAATASGMIPVALGLGGGLVVAFAGSSVLRTLLYGIAPRFLPPYFVALVLVAAVAGLAAWLPARRAAAIEPSTALRAD